MFQRLLCVSSFCVEAPGHRFGERESGDVFEKPNGRRNRIVLRMAQFFQCTMMSLSSHKYQYPLFQQRSLGPCVQLFLDHQMASSNSRRRIPELSSFQRSPVRLVRRRAVCFLRLNLSFAFSIRLSTFPWTAGY